jgi:hypothetical protein
MYVYIRMHVPNLRSARPYLHPRPRASESLHVCARARASAVPPRTTGRAAFEARPSASAVVHAGGPGAAHTWYNEVTAAVFHAPMFALNADAEENACAPKPHAVDADGARSHGSARMRARRSTPAPTRARTSAQHVRASAADPSACTRIHVYLNAAGSNIYV